MTPSAAAPTQPAASSTIAMCFAAALIEGVDLQSMGIAASGISAEFHFSRSALGAILTASPCGLLFGAFLGGRFADLRGRKSVLIASMMSFGAFQFATIWGASASSLLLIRFLCGVGLGGALPTLIALTAEAGEGRNPILNVVVAVAAMPLGGAIAAYIGFISANNWRLLFYIGGIAPLILAPLMVLFLKESRLFRQTRAKSRDERERVLAALFAKVRRRRTALLWMSFLGTALVLYLLVNWLPQLMIARGFTHSQSFSIQIVFNLAAAAGAMGLGWIMQRCQHQWLLPACFCGLATSILLLASMANDVLLVAAIAAVMGVCLVGAQFILYGIAPGYYTTLVRGTGTGAAVAVGRLGAVVGPFFAGQLLARGASAGQVMVSLLPIVLIAALAASILTHMPRLQDLQEGSDAPV